MEQEVKDDEMPIGGRKPGVIFVLEEASLEIAKVGEDYQLLSRDEHTDYLSENNRNPEDYRPDIAHLAIQTILDSRLNACGRLKALFVKTQQGLVIHFKPYTDIIPTGYKSFCRLMVKLLQEGHTTEDEDFYRVITSPVAHYLPVNSRKIGLSHSSEKLVDMYDYVGTIDNGLDLVFVVGAMAHGKIDEEYVDDFVSISEFPTSAAYCISTITASVERLWKLS